MKKLSLYITLLFATSVAIAQNDTPAVQEKQAMPQGDTTSVNTQIKQESEIRTMDAVKTQDHPKVTPKPHKDFVKANKKKKRNRSAVRRDARP